MKYNLVKGDLLEVATTKQNFCIVHSANNRGVMGSGVAKAIINTFPDVLKDYKEEYENYANQQSRWLGEVIYTPVNKTGNNYGVVTTIIGQEGYGYDGRKYVDYEALKKGLTSVKLFCQHHHLEYIAMPKLGAGLGGGDWRVIESILDNVFYNKEVYVYEL